MAIVTRPALPGPGRELQGPGPRRPRYGPTDRDLARQQGRFDQSHGNAFAVLRAAVRPANRDIPRAEERTFPQSGCSPSGPPLPTSPTTGSPPRRTPHPSPSWCGRPKIRWRTEHDHREPKPLSDWIVSRAAPPKSSPVRADASCHRCVDPTRVRPVGAFIAQLPHRMGGQDPRPRGSRSKERAVG